MLIETEIINLIKKVLEKEGQSISEINLEVPKNRIVGDLSTNIALVLGQKAAKSSLEIAQQICLALRKEIDNSSLAKQIDRLEVKQPGFINFFVNKICFYEVLEDIKKEGRRFGRLKLGQRKRVHIEFVSANPTGPLNVAHARQAAFGDTLAKLLEFAGYKVWKEYYLNDEGVQIDLLGESLRARYLELSGVAAEFPTLGYRGRYIDELSRQFLKRYGRKFVNVDSSAAFARFACRKILKQIKRDLNSFAVRYNNWFSQKKLVQSGKVTQALELLKKKGFIYQKEGAWWLASSKFADDKDRVVIKSDSTFTYITPDIAYHQSKFNRRFDKIINIWGPDHHGYILRIKAAVAALGYDAGLMTVLIVQLVSLLEADKIIPMSTRQGQFVSLHDIIQAVGKDAARFFFLMRKRDAHLHFDLELAKKRSLENPVYYVQYAHARIRNILKYAKKAQGWRLKYRRRPDLLLLDKPEELSLIQLLSQFPAIVESCVLNLEPHRITAYLQELAKGLHHYYEIHKVVTKDLPLSYARLALINAVGVVLNNGLRLLSVSTPEKM